MMYSALLSLLAAPALANPIVRSDKWKRNNLQGMDFEIVNLARNLESLELAYWNFGLDTFSDDDFSQAGLDGYRDYIRQFRDHEIVHFTVLNEVAGGGFQNCTYDGAKQVSTIEEFLAQGQVVTTVGEGAFIGALELLNNGEVRKSGGSIIGNEARQNSKLREGLGLQFFNSYPLDTPLTASEAYSLAYPFLTGCPASNAPINFPLIPALTVAFASDNHDAGAEVSISWDSSSVYLGDDVFIKILDKSDAVRADLTQTGDGQGTINLPANLVGTVFLVATNYDGPAPIPDGQNFGIGYLVVN